MRSHKQKSFLLLQGPHGPFFGSLSKMLEAAGSKVWRVGFNRGDQFFWPNPDSYIPFRGGLEDWPERFAEICGSKGITDLVLYGDSRPIHANAIAHAKKVGITVHVFEEGYLRPYWITYERDGSNGNSRLTEMSLSEMRKALSGVDQDQPDAPAVWGDMRQHIFYGALYHALVLLNNRSYRKLQPHRDISLGREFFLYFLHLITMPWASIHRRIANHRVASGGFPYHLVLLQLAHDANFRAHSSLNGMEEFVRLTVDAFAKGAPGHHHLVFKAHPLEDGRAAIRHMIEKEALSRGILDRVHFVRGGKLARLLHAARTTVTVNSTAAQQALWRGLPLKVFGNSVYAKPEFVSDQPLPEFFASPDRPDSRAYREYRQYLLQTSQLTGGYYSRRGRHHVLRQVVDLILAEQDPYDALANGTATPRQQLHLVQ